jgi:hypothetical protein
VTYVLHVDPTYVQFEYLNSTMSPSVLYVQHGTCKTSLRPFVRTVLYVFKYGPSVFSLFAAFAASCVGGVRLKLPSSPRSLPCEVTLKAQHHRLC